jgi:glycerophosphoryl diester phosphodiesterase
VAPRNFGRTAVVVPPSPATSGLSLTVTDSTGATTLGTGPVVLCPADVDPTPANAEVAIISNVAGDTITLSSRAAEGTTARTVVAGWQVIQGITAGMWNDVAPDLVAELYATDQFVIGHRLGGGDEAPEMSEVGSERALASGQKAVELSSQATVDGALIGMHDSTPDRTTSLASSPAIADLSLAQLVSAPVIDIGATHLGSGWSASQRVPLTGNELRRWERRGVVFLEPKSDATRNLTAVTGFQDPGKWIVHKFNRNSNGSLPSHATNARAAGLRLWVYMTSGDATSLVDTVLATLQPGDAIGVDVDDTDNNIEYTCDAAAALGIPVIGFVVRRRHERDRLQALGVNGYMCTSPTYLRDDAAAFTTDGFSGLVRRPGEYEGASNKLIGGFTAAETSVTLAQGTTATLHMGSMSPVAQADGLLGGYTIEGEIRWSAVDGSTAHSDIYFAHVSDTPYAHLGTTNEDGYGAFFGLDGRIRLFTHTNGTATVTQIGSTVTTTAPSANVWYPWRITVTDTTVSWQRTSDVTTATTASNTLARGGHWGLCSGSSSTAAQFRNLVVTAL